MAWGWVNFQQIYFFGWTIPLKLQMYSFCQKKNYREKNIIKSHITYDFILYKWFYYLFLLSVMYICVLWYILSYLVHIALF